VCELVAGAKTLAAVDPEADVGSCLAFEPGAGLLDQPCRVLVVAARNRHHRDLYRRHPRRDDQAGLVAVSHDQAADDPRRQAPGRLEGVLPGIGPVCVLDPVRGGEVLAQVV